MRQACGARGIVHVHTEFSFDGILQPLSISEMCRRRGYSFAAITDHAESVNERLLERQVALCEAHSDQDFVLIPGLEHRYRRGVHILALGQRRWVEAPSPTDLLKTLVEDGCVLVAAHCTSTADLSPELLEIITAVEIWNVTRDTRILPTSRYLPVYQKWAEKHPKLYAIGGLDMHKGIEWGCETVLDSPCECSPPAILDKLRSGRFWTRGRFLSFGSQPVRSVSGIAFAAGDALAGVRDLRDRVLR